MCEICDIVVDYYNIIYIISLWDVCEAKCPRLNLRFLLTSDRGGAP